MIDRIFFPAFSACLLTVAALAAASALRSEGTGQSALVSTARSSAAPSTAVVQLPRIVITAKRSDALAAFTRTGNAGVAVAARSE
jgi:hypothetical protein